MSSIAVQPGQKRSVSFAVSLLLAAGLVAACGGSTTPEAVPPLSVSSSGALIGSSFAATSANAYVIGHPAGNGEPDGIEVVITIADWSLTCNDPGIDGGRWVDIRLTYFGASTIAPGTYFMSPHDPVFGSIVAVNGRLFCAGTTERGDSVTITHHSAGYVAGSFAFASGLTGSFSVPIACAPPTPADYDRRCTRLTDASAAD